MFITLLIYCLTKKTYITKIIVSQ